MIQLHQLDFGYRKAEPVFKNLNLTIQPGSICGLLGKNGAGKTTLLRLMNGLLFPKGGQSTVDGKATEDRNVDMLSEMYYLQEEYNLPKTSIASYGETNGPFYPKWNQTKFIEICDLFEINPARRIKDLSFGQKKKTLIAFALSTNCNYLFLDEPTNGLDIPSKALFRKAITTGLNDAQTVIISTHQVKDIANLLDRVIMVEKGQVIMNENLYDLGMKYSFDFLPGNQKPVHYLYAEPVPGGHIILNENTSGQSSDVDIEILFNAILSKSFHL